MAIFGLKIYQFAYNSKTSRCVQLKFVHSVGAYKCFMQTAWSRDRKVTDQA